MGTRAAACKWIISFGGLSFLQLTVIIFENFWKMENKGKVNLIKGTIQKKLMSGILAARLRTSGKM